jgi:predicted MFS family arabinose efflux permease
LKIVSVVILVLLIMLSLLSGISKVMLIQQEVDFFGSYGFSQTMIVVFGLAQVVGGILMGFKKARSSGAALIALTFLISLILLLMEGNIPASVITVIAILLLGVVFKQNWKLKKAEL